MANLTPEQTLAMADNLTSVQNTLTAYKLAKYSTLQSSDQQKVDTTLANLSDAASKLYAKTVIIQFDDVQSSIKNVQDACNQINSALNTIADVQKVIDLISTVASLATAIASSNPTGIINSASSIITSIQGL